MYRYVHAPERYLEITERVKRYKHDRLFGRKEWNGAERPFGISNSMLREGIIITFSDKLVGEDQKVTLRLYIAMR